jgi:hypothetical protein
MNLGEPPRRASLARRRAIRSITCGAPRTRGAHALAGGSATIPLATKPKRNSQKIITYHHFFFLSMKFISSFLLSAFLLAFATPTQAQELNAQDLLDKILRLEPLLQYKTFKTDFQTEIAELSARPMSAADYDALQTSYTKIKNQFDKFIGMIKQDILDFKNIKKMTKNESFFAEKYADAFNQAVNIHKDEFMPLVERIKGKERFALLSVLAPLGKMAFDGIARWIKNKRLDKDELMSDLLQIVNTSFVDKLKMKPWHSIAAEHTPIKANNNNNNNNPINNKEEPIPNKNNNNNNGGKKTKKSGFNVDYPTTKELSGSLEFRLASGENMAFLSGKTKSRDLGIGTLNSANGTKEGVFTTEKRYSEGTQFQITTENSGLMYVFAFNSNNTCFAIYPYSAEWVNGFGMKKSKNRDLTINPLMLKNDEDNSLSIPSPRADTGEENYITISGNSRKEQLCVLLSKSEIDFEALLQAINEGEGTLSERLEAVLGDTAKGYEHISVQKNVFSFDLNQLETPVLPLIFEIQR